MNYTDFSCLHFSRPVADLLRFRDSDRVLSIEFQRQEIEILRSKLPKRITFTLREKARLVQYGKKLGATIRYVVTIHPHRYSPGRERLPTRLTHRSFIFHD